MMSVQVAPHLFLDQVSICPSPSYTLVEYSGKIFKITNIHDDPEDKYSGKIFTMTLMRSTQVKLDPGGFSPQSYNELYSAQSLKFSIFDQ